MVKNMVLMTTYRLVRPSHDGGYDVAETDTPGDGIQFEGGGLRSDALLHFVNRRATQQ